MADCCVFCGKELKRFEKVELACAGVAQLACKDCWNKYKDVPKIGQYRAMLSAGWAAEPEKLRAILAELEQEGAGSASGESDTAPYTAGTEGQDRTGPGA